MINTLTLSEEEISLINKSRAYTELINSSAWRYLLTFIKKEMTAALSEHREVEGTPEFIALSRQRWLDRENFLNELLFEVEGTIEQRRRWLTDLANARVSPDQLEAALLNQVNPRSTNEHTEHPPYA